MFAFCNPYAHAELHQQKHARKLCSAILILQGGPGYQGTDVNSYEQRK